MRPTLGLAGWPGTRPVSAVGRPQTSRPDRVGRPACRVSGLLAILGALLTVALGAAAAAAQAPTKETTIIDETFEDEFLTEACGVAVTTTATGKITFFTFPDRPVGPQDLTTVNVAFVATAGDNQIRF